MTASDPRPAVDPALVDFAVQIAREAGTLTLRYFRRTDLDVESKGDGTPVTAHDYVATFRFSASPDHAWDFAWYYTFVD